MPIIANFSGQYNYLSRINDLVLRNTVCAADVSNFVHGSIIFDADLVQSISRTDRIRAPPPRPPHMPGQARTSKPIGTPCDAFNDGELTDCRKITPEELCFLGRRACMLRNNRFLQYGYYNFGHLLLCRNTCGQWILGVPGGYDQQERFMANMFGFSYFKESPNIRIPKGKGGYWYRLIDAPNLNS